MKIAVASVLPLMAAGFVSAQTVIHVAPGGSDTNPGTAQSPLATLAGARERVRQVKQGGTSVTGCQTITGRPPLRRTSVPTAAL